MYLCFLKADAFSREKSFFLNVFSLSRSTGIVMSDVTVYESLESAGVYGSLGAPSPLTPRSLHCTGSTNSSASHLSEDDPLYQTCFYQPNNSKGDGEDASDGSISLEDKPQRTRSRLLRPTSELFASAKTSLSRSASTRSYLRGSSSSASSSSSAPAGEKQQCGAFSSLQRKPKRTSIRRRLLKYIPGLNRALEEEESKL